MTTVQERAQKRLNASIGEAPTPRTEACRGQDGVPQRYLQRRAVNHLAGHFYDATERGDAPRPIFRMEVYELF